MARFLDFTLRFLIYAPSMTHLVEALTLFLPENEFLWYVENKI